MKIIYASTITLNETLDIFYDNVRHLKKLNLDLMVIANTNHKIKNLAIEIRQIKDVKDIRSSRIALHTIAKQYKADAYFIFDSDINLTNLTTADFSKMMAYSKKYDFISLYYKGDPPIPAFYTLASSLNDYYNQQQKLQGQFIPFFDDSDFNNATHQIPNAQISCKKFREVLYGRSFARDIPEFVDTIDEKDTTTGGATIYFSKELLEPEFDWPIYKNKSLVWYDSYRSYMLSQKWKFAKIPIFVNHLRHSNSIQLNWDSVIRYIIGFNYYMKAKHKYWNNKALKLHTVELFYFIKGMIEKIEQIKISNEDTKTINEIRSFMDVNILEIIKETDIWK